MEKYKLMNGITLDENQYRKYQQLMNQQGLYVVRWMTDDEFKQAIEKAQNTKPNITHGDTRED